MRPGTVLPGLRFVMVMPLPTRQTQIDFNDFTPPSVKGVERGQCYVTQSVIILSAVALSDTFASRAQVSNN